MTTRELTTGQSVVLGIAAVAMVVVGGFGAWGTYTNAAAEFHRQATAAGVVAAGEGLTLILALVMLGRTMLNMASPGVVRGGMWAAPVSASAIGISIASNPREAAVYAVTPLAMSGAAEGLGFVARSVVVYRTGLDAETMRRNADAARQLAFHGAVAAGHPDERKRQSAVRRYWRLARHVGVGDAELGAGLVEDQRTRVRAGADAALASMYGAPAPAAETAPVERPRTSSATEVLRERFAAMDPAEAIHLAHDARPDAGPVELATLLGAYGMTVDPVAVALVLGRRAPEYEVHRPDAPDAPQVSALEPLDLQGAIEEAASALGPDASPRAIVDRLRDQRRLIATEAYVRTALSRASKKPQPDSPAKPMEGGYA